MTCITSVCWEFVQHDVVHDARDIRTDYQCTSGIVRICFPIFEVKMPASNERKSSDRSKSFHLFAQVAGMLTLDGHCKTLDVTADGYARAEACVVMLLKSCVLNDSLDNSSAVMLQSTFVNQDGRSSSLTAPNGPSQQQVWGQDSPLKGHVL